MSVFQAAVLGIVQGLTEFLPVSSSGHLILVPRLLGWETQDLAFDAAIHLATLAAILAALWTEVAQIVRGLARWKTDPWGRLGWMIVVSTLPVLVIGFVFKDMIEVVFRSSHLVALSLGFWGILLFIADRLVSKGALSDVRLVGWKRALGIGATQALALLPGTSRSGVTITAGLFSGLNRETAATFSFLLGVPATAAAGAGAILDLATGQAYVEPLPLVAGFVTAFVSGFFAIRFLLKLMKGASYAWFAVYRISLAALILFLF
ncbi:undecaprenyl-diphosphatase UppP [Candidatus Uhrbacteria bacterium]|nr:undecaprenyl-diphosphatase UppP [Candidatus Uhrbacteria bacterium]